MLGSVVEPPTPVGRPRTALAVYLEREAGGCETSALLDVANTSVPLSALVDVGGFDERIAARADADLGMRLAGQGCALVELPNARVTRGEPTTIADLRDRSIAAARALARAGAAALEETEPVLREPVHAARERCSTLEAAAGELGAIDLAAVSAMGAGCTTLAARLEMHLAELLEELRVLWRERGRLAGLGDAHEVRARTGARTGANGEAPRPRDSAAIWDTPAALAPLRVELSVLAPTRSRPAQLAQLLDALERQDLEPERFELLIVDDGSEPPLVLPERSARFGVRVLRRSGGGPGKARNRAAREARGEHLLLLNDDAVPGPGLLRGHLDAQRFASSPCAVIGTFALLPQHRAHSIGAYVESTTTLFAQPAMKPGVLYDGLSFCSGNVSLPKAALEAVGGFDESLPHAGGEDSELGLRLERALGLRVRFEPALQCGHDHALDVAAILRRKRVMGWVVHRIQTKHGDLGLLPLPAWPPAPDDLARIEQELLQKDADATRLERDIRQICEREVTQRSGPTALPKIAPIMRELERLATLAGVLAAERGAPAPEANVASRAEPACPR